MGCAETEMTNGLLRLVGARLAPGLNEALPRRIVCEVLHVIDDGQARGLLGLVRHDGQNQTLPKVWISGNSARIVSMIFQTFSFMTLPQWMSVMPFWEASR